MPASKATPITSRSSPVLETNCFRLRVAPPGFGREYVPLLQTPDSGWLFPCDRSVESAPDRPYRIKTGAHTLPAGRTLLHSPDPQRTVPDSALSDIADTDASGCDKRYFHTGESGKSFVAAPGFHARHSRLGTGRNIHLWRALHRDA